MLLIAGSWYSHSAIARYEDALTVLDRVSEREATPSFRTMILRLKAYYNWGKLLKEQAAAETDAVAKAELEALSKEKFARAVEVGNATVSLHAIESEGFLYLSMAQMEMGDYNASDANFKTYQELEGRGRNKCSALADNEECVQLLAHDVLEFGRAPLDPRWNPRRRETHEG